MKSLNEDLKTGQLNNVYLLYGEEAYLRKQYRDKLKEVLVDESARLIEVALQCGFESQSYFNRMFKQQCGMTPRQYRKLMVNQ